MKKKTNLAQYTKADLIWIIEYMSRLGNEMYLQYALSELRQKKEVNRINEAEKYAAISHKKRLEYIDLLSPYAGQPVNIVPISIVKKAEKAMKEAQDADKKYLQLMNIKE